VKTSDAGINLIKQFEGLRLDAYICPAGIPTIGYGHTGEVRLGMKITEAEATELLREDLERFERCVEDACTTELTQHEFDSLVCFAFNVGCAALKASTLLRLLNQGDKHAAAAQFLRWNKSGGKELAGLTRRRDAERDLFLA
jgi:lysozyme